MDPAVLAMIVETAFTLIVAFGVAILLKRLLAHASGPRVPEGEAIADRGSWSELETRFATLRGPDAPIARRVSVKIGVPIWKNCVAVGADDAGLRLEVKTPILGGMGRRPLLVPWDEIVEVHPVRLYWKSARQLVVGRPPLATVTLPEAVWETILARGWATPLTRR
ncbi:MAG: hypothetical protein LWW93_14995 [Hyphomicrobiales bacterium]|nr:hypothetical protein [Hyphomicrobiales bacterium]